MKKKLLGIELPYESESEILEKILKYTKKPKGNCFIMSLNPEIFVLMHQNSQFKKAVIWGQMKIIDGVGVALAARVLGIRTGDRVTGVDLMDKVLQAASKERLSVVLIGGKEKVAERLSDCYRKGHLNLNILGFQGIKDIHNPTKSEEDKIFSIVADRKPHIMFLAFGSPAQELWLYKHKKKLQGIVCAGVGGSFDFLVGDASRAPKLLRMIGLEWLYRLIKEPWRWKRQVRLLHFMVLVLRQKLEYPRY